jgi:hypothetical protein
MAPVGSLRQDHLVFLIRSHSGFFRLDGLFTRDEEWCLEKALRGRVRTRNYIGLSMVRTEPHGDEEEFGWFPIVLSSVEAVERGRQTLGNWPPLLSSGEAGECAQKR